MQSNSNKNLTNSRDNSKNTVISIKVSAKEKAQLQEMANEVELSLSEFLRLKGLSKVNKMANHEKLLKEKEEEVKKLKVALSFFEANVTDTPGIVFHLTEQQKELLLAIFNNYYQDGKPVEHQIIHYLVEDLLTTHYDLSEGTIYTYKYQAARVMIPVRKEYPCKRGCDPGILFNAFKDYDLAGYRELLQVKHLP